MATISDTFTLLVVAVSREGIAAQLGGPPPRGGKSISDSATQNPALLGAIDDTTSPDGTFEVLFGYTLGVPAASGAFQISWKKLPQGVTDPLQAVAATVNATIRPRGPLGTGPISSLTSGDSAGLYGGTPADRAGSSPRRAIPYNLVQVGRVSGTLPEDRDSGDRFIGTIYMWQ